MLIQGFWRGLFVIYFALLSWQLLTPVTVVNPGSWDKLVHFAGFFVLAVLARLGWMKGAATNLIVLLIVYAALTELLQHFIPGRSFSIMDWLADGLGVLFAVIASQQLFNRVFTVVKAP